MPLASHQCAQRQLLIRQDGWEGQQNQEYLCEGWRELRPRPAGRPQRQRVPQQSLPAGAQCPGRRPTAARAQPGARGPAAPAANHAQDDESDPRAYICMHLSA